MKYPGLLLSAFEFTMLDLILTGCTGMRTFYNNGLQDGEVPGPWKQDKNGGRNIKVSIVDSGLTLKHREQEELGWEL